MSQSKIDSLIEYLKINGKNKSWKELTKQFNPGAPNDWSRSSCRVRGFKPEAEHTGLEEACDDAGIPVDKVTNYWHKGQHYSIHVRDNKDVTLEDAMNGILDKIKDYAPKYSTIQYQPSGNGRLLVIDPADLHLNKLASAWETGDSYCIEKARERVLEGVKGILQWAVGFNIKKILYIAGNDRLHVDTPRNTTTAGTPQDTHLMWYDAFKFAHAVDVEILELLMQVAPVHYQLDLSNHDYTTGFYLAQAVAAWFRNSENITFNVSPAHRKYFRYGKNLIGSTHGDGAKESDLPLLMAHEAGIDWAECTHKYWYCHHLHHKKSKEHMGVMVEYVSSASGTDSWHHRNGFQHGVKAIEGFIHDEQHGQIARLNYIF